MTNQSTTRQVLELQHEADNLRKIAKEHAEIGDSMSEEFYRLDAEALEKKAAVLMVPIVSPVVSIGEVVPNETGTAQNHYLRSTLKSPDSAAIDASTARTELLMQEDLEITALAIDAANSIDANNSIEKMLVHQMSAAHRVSMQLMNRASGLISQTSYDPRTTESLNQQASKLFNSSIRMMNSFQQGLLTLNKIRNGGNQTVTVQHVTVSQGGQAVIGNLGSEDRTRQGTNQKGPTPHE
jgi:hypothetical protein